MWLTSFLRVSPSFSKQILSMVPKVFSTYLSKFPRKALIVTRFKSLLFKKYEVKPAHQQSIPLWTSAILRSDMIYPAPPLIVHSSPTSKKLSGPVLEIVQIVSAPTSVTQSPSFLPAESQLKELQQDVSDIDRLVFSPANRSYFHRFTDSNFWLRRPGNVAISNPQENLFPIIEDGDAWNVVEGNPLEDNFFVEIINHLQTTSTCLILTRPLFDRTNSAVYRQFGRLTLEGSVCHISWVPGIQGEFYVTGSTETYHFTAEYDAETQAAVSFQFPSYLLFFDTHPLNRDRWEDGFFQICQVENEVLQSYFCANESHAEISKAPGVVPEQILAQTSATPSRASSGRRKAAGPSKFCTVDGKVDNGDGSVCAQPPTYARLGADYPVRCKAHKSAEMVVKKRATSSKDLSSQPKIVQRSG